MIGFGKTKPSLGGYESNSGARAGRPTTGYAARMLILPNEANFAERLKIWIGLRDKVLAIKVWWFYNWLRS